MLFKERRVYVKAVGRSVAGGSGERQRGAPCKILTKGDFHVHVGGRKEAGSMRRGGCEPREGSCEAKERGGGGLRGGLPVSCARSCGEQQRAESVRRFGRH